MQRLGKVHQVEDVLLEARSTESLVVRDCPSRIARRTHNRRLQELGADSRVLADSVSDLVNGSTGGLADGGQGVDGRDSLGEHSVGSELGELGRPEADGEDSLLGDPVGVDVGEGLASVLARLALERTDQNTVRGEQVIDGGTLGKELCLSAGVRCQLRTWQLTRVGEDVEGASRLRVGLEDGSHGTIASGPNLQRAERDSLGGSARDSRLLNHDLGRGRNLGDSSRSELEIAARQLPPHASFASAHFKSAAKPAPIPLFLVGVLTETKMRLPISVVLD